MEAMDEGNVDIPEAPNNMLLGENLCPAFISNESKLIDLYFKTVKSIEEDEVKRLLAAAWREHPLMTLKIIFNSGNVRSDGGGKSDRINFHRGLNWLWQLDPEIVLANLEQVHEHTSLKVLLDSFMYIVHMDTVSMYNLGVTCDHANDHRKRKNRPGYQKITRRQEKSERRDAIWKDFAKSIGVDKVEELRVKVENNKESKERKSAHYTKWKSEEIRQKYAEFIKAREKALAEEGKGKRKKLLKEMVDNIKSRRQDANIERLYQKVIDIFIKGLKAEYKMMKDIEAGKKGSVSGLFGKWAPTRHGKHDKATGIAKMLVLQLIPELGFTIPADASVEAFSRIYQKEVLAKIRKVAEVPEHFVGKGEWSLVNYDRMASLCRLLFGTKVFRKHDTERYDQYLKDSALQAVENKTSKKQGVKTGVLLPHQVVQKAEGIYRKNKDGPQTPADIMEVVEVNLQWWGLVQACRAAMREGDSKLGNCLPVCDVSGSMHGEPMEVAVALSMLLAESTPTDSPFHKLICTFDSNPRMMHLDNLPDYDTPVDKDLLEACRKEDNIKADSPILGLLGDVGKRAHEVKGYEWGGSTNLDATFDLLLNVAVESKVSNEFMEKTCIIIFSDMEFDCAIEKSEPDTSWWETMHERIMRKFSAAGFKTIPKVVYWNLRASRSQPIESANYKDVALLSGFSSNLMKSFLKGDLDQFTPINQLMQVLSHPMYAKLIVPEGCKELPPDAEGDLE